MEEAKHKGTKGDVDPRMFETNIPPIINIMQ
jgi:hypothetical protein